MFKRIDHVEIAPSDLEWTIRFYTENLGFELKERIRLDSPELRQVVYLVLGDTTLELLDYTEPPAPRDPSVRVGYRLMALEVDDMAQSLAFLKERGIEPTWGPFDVGGGSMRAEIADVDGLPIELRQW
jgi:catechol 2,3-dioxygenase-like lactoylglutathione lyase family enzyme